MTEEVHLAPVDAQLKSGRIKKISRSIVHAPKIEKTIVTGTVVEQEEKIVLWIGNRC